jgi:hypothetical protein
VVDPNSGIMTVHTSNLSHRRLLNIEEMCVITRPSSTIAGDVEGGTMTDTIQSVKCSDKLWGIAGRIEAFSASKFAENFNRSRQAMMYVLERLPAPPSRRI